MRRLTLVFALAMVLWSARAGAAPLDITNLAGVWINPAGGANLTGVGTADITWGDGMIPDSGYSFLSGPNLLAAALGVPLLMGTFTHFNEVVPVASAITNVDLSLSFDTNGLPALLNAVFLFTHNETDNAPGPPLSDDIVTITTPLVNIPIVVGVDLYFFNLLGFSTDGGVTFNSVYTSPENSANAAALYGLITTQQIPEPASALLIAVGLAVVARRLRTRRRRS